MQNLISVVGTATAILIALVIAYAGGQDSVQGADSISLYALCIALAFLTQWILFVPAYLRRTEKFFDLTGSCTFIGVSLIALFLNEERDIRTWIVAMLVVIWALRLGSFLNKRVRLAEQDRRFRSIKHDFLQFLMTWTLQGLWVVLSYAAGLVVLTTTQHAPLDAFAGVGIVLWGIGFVIEVLADRQKTQFRAIPENKGKFITSGLWSWSQHPNYFGEILLWIGIAIIALPVLNGWSYVTLISPIFIWLLLTRISGIRMLDNLAKRDWGDDEAYQKYASQTAKLIPLPPKSSNP